MKTQIVVPRLNANDDSCLLVAWLLPDGGAVEEDAPVAIVETAKAAVQVTAESTGFVVQIGTEGEVYEVGTVIGHIFADAERAAEVTSGLRSQNTPAGEVIISDPARRLAEERGIPEEALRSLGLRIVRTADVKLMRAQEPNSSQEGREWRQRVIARTVERSHREVPAAHVQMHICVDNIVAQDKGPLGPLPRLLKAVVAARAVAPHVFGWYVDDKFVAAPDPSAVGVTVDLGTGLWVPVIRDLELLSLTQVSEEILRLGHDAARERLSAADLENGQFTVSLPSGCGVRSAVAMILPPQVAILSIGDPIESLVLDSAGLVQRTRSIAATLTYDHRVINGREAAEFLAAVRESVESPASV